MTSRQLCPACTHRENHLIDPDCLICDGVGIIYLGDPALTIYPAEVVAEAVTITLEAAARLGDTTGTLSDDRQAHLRAALLDLRDAGLLDSETTTLTRAMASKTGARNPAVALAAEVIQEPISGLDQLLPHAEPHQYAESDRPGRRGTPVLSANGHPSHLARVCDPRDPTLDTPADVRRRRRKARQARVLSEAAREVQAVRARKGRWRQDEQLPVSVAA
ncbi:hypothetical protein [Nesterenkonia suensis]